jgi:hypothetical protein
MASHHVIEEYLDQLATRLPSDAVDELADGLTETWHRYLDTGVAPDQAAQAAIAEFGDARQVTAAFVAHAPGRRVAPVLLATGPHARSGYHRADRHLGPAARTLADSGMRGGDGQATARAGVRVVRSRSTSAGPPAQYELAATRQRLSPVKRAAINAWSWLRPPHPVAVHLGSHSAPAVRPPGRAPYE